MRVGCAEVAGELVQSIAPDEDTWLNIEYAIVSVDLVYRCTATGGIALAEDLLQVPIKKLDNSLGHRRLCPYSAFLSEFSACLYLPLKLGWRFSKKALRASCASSLLKAIRILDSS